MNKQNQSTPKATKDDPFADCILTQRIRRGEYPKYSYPQNGLPKLRVKSAPGRSPILNSLGIKG